MSRSLTSAQVIGLGEYLNPNFDPSSLTVSQLLGVLGFHNIQYPSPYTKPKLVQLFLDEITSNSVKLKRERLKKDNSLASDDGITDGMTGKPISKEKKPPIRRSLRKSSRVNSEDEEALLQPEPPKRRRSSAAPALGRTASRKVPPSQPVLVEESEPEEDQDEIVVRKVGRSKKNGNAAGTKARRVSTAEDSGWEDNNIFQSGAESSSPARPSPPKPKLTRKSLTRASRTSMSAPPQLSPSSSPPKALQFAEYIKQAQQSPNFKFEPSLPNFSRESQMEATRSPQVKYQPLSPSQVPAHVEESEEDELNVIGMDSGIAELDKASVADQSVVETGPVDEIETNEDQSIAISKRIAQGGSLQIASSATRSTPLYQIVLILILGLGSATGIYNYKTESAPIGYCDTGKDTNVALEGIKAKWNAIEACNRENRTFLQLPPFGASSEESILCPPPALLPFLHPTECTPCPEHGICSGGGVKCEKGYLPQPHPLLNLLSPIGSSDSPLALKARDFISKISNGLPGLGSVAFPNRCVEDPQRKKHIGTLGKVIESLLGQERGLRLCAGDIRHPFASEDGGEARTWGMEMGQLHDSMKKPMLKKAPESKLLDTFEDTFNEAVQQLLQWGGVILGEDSAGKRYLAVREPNLTWNCAITVKSREVWNEWRNSLFGIVAVIISGWFARGRKASRAIENKRVAELVQIALDTLRNQELAHHTDPVTSPQPFLSSLQLRDLILQDEHSISSRRRLWDQVERVVESNANVRANLEEVQGGEELRVWRWVGGAGASPRRVNI